MRSVLARCLPLVIAVGLPSQTTHLVGPGGLPQIRAALAIAAPGDVIHVLPGTYAHFDANVGVTIRALTPGTVTVVYDPAYASPGCAANPFCINEGPTRLQPPAGQTLHVVGIDFRQGSSTAGPPWHRVFVNSGRVTLDRCNFLSQALGALAITNATVHMQDCTTSCQISFGGGSPAPGLTAGGSDLTATRCQFWGTVPAFLGVMQFPHEGLRLQGSRLHASHLTITGGSVPFPGNPNLGAPALSVDGASMVWLSDSNLLAGPNSCAISGTGATTTRLDRCTLTSNTGGCTTGVTTPFLLGVDRPAPLSPGAVFTLSYRTEPNGFVLVFASDVLGTVDYAPLLEQPSWLGENTAFVAGLFLADATGLATASWPIPAGPFSDLTLWFKGISGFTFPLQASAPAGGVVR